MALRTINLLPNPKRSRISKRVKKKLRRRAKGMARRRVRHRSTAHGFLIQQGAKGHLRYLCGSKWLPTPSRATRFATLKAARQKCREVAQSGLYGADWVQPVPA
jgi:hypothetical protein